jgi:hypothetical protein
MLGIYPKEMESVHQRDIYIPMLIVPLLTTAKKWKQSKCPSADECPKKMW